MEEKKILDFTMENGENVSVFMLNEDGDEPRLLFIEKSMSFYRTWIAAEAHDILSAFFTKDNCLDKFNYISEETTTYLSKQEAVDTLTDLQKIILYGRIIEYWSRLIEESEVC